MITHLQRSKIILLQMMLTQQLDNKFVVYNRHHESNKI